MRRPLTPRDLLRRRLSLAWLALWMISLALPVARFEDSGYDWMRGWVLLAFGGLGGVVGQFGWFANLTFVALTGGAFTFRATPRTDLPLSLVSVICAADAFFWRAMYADSGQTAVRSFAIGFYAWQIAILGSAATTIWYWVDRKREHRALP